jgi:hypothetical protein
MNKKVLVIAVALMAVAMLATPLFGTVNACGNRRCEKQTEKIPVQLGGPYTLSPPEVKVCGNLQIGRGGTMYYPGPFAIVDLRTTPPTLLVGGGLTTSLWTVDYVVNTKTGKGVVYYDVVITIPSKGTFEGNIIVLGKFSIAGLYVKHEEGFRYGVLRGTGDYEGWKLVLSGKTTGGVTTWENYMYKPLT